MSNQPQNDTRTPNKGVPANQGGQKAGPDAQQRRDAHSNSSSAGKSRDDRQQVDSDQDDDSGDVRGQHSSTQNLQTEPDRARNPK